MRLRAWRRALLCVTVVSILPMYQSALAGGQQAPPAPRRLVLVDRDGNQTALGEVPRDEANDCSIGDRVQIIEHRPLSKRKRWKVQSTVARATGV